MPRVYGAMLRIARASGHRFYQGNPCKGCSCTQRYSCNGACVRCTRTKAAAVATATRERKLLVEN